MTIEPTPLPGTQAPTTAPIPAPAPATRPSGALMHRLGAWLFQGLDAGVAGLNALQSPAVFLARCYVAKAFFASGLTKLADWDTTLFLFTEEYHVPLLPPELAAWMGTGGELVLPVLLALGLFGRFAALGLSVMNVVAVLSLSEIAPAALIQHQLWGALLLMVALFGPRAWSVDAWLGPKLRAWCATHFFASSDERAVTNPTGGAN